MSCFISELLEYGAMGRMEVILNCMVDVALVMERIFGIFCE